MEMGKARGVDQLKSIGVIYKEIENNFSKLTI